MRERDRGSRGGARAMPASAMDAARVTRGRSETARALSLGRCAAARRRRCCVRRSRSATTAYLVPVWSIFLLRGPHPRPVAVRGVKTLNETMRLCVFLFGNPGASGALLCEMARHGVIDVRSRGLTRTPVAALRSAGSHSEVSHWRGASAVRI